ncbi:(2Fe-2S)-binding protein [Streptomyces sp. Vc74B-19]|uniref:(2Fe-2S)-binding protein n=1 Tax=unclassified Streptomyces TaxID=2593676 RepID=UPI001BFC76C7|nr:MULTISPECIES: (2Fe-2S)-binding protein [unclassified Streptomyces]MBT3166738.1 (2Fe-2S)-binding protein [Streptomyces sp. Vc74B-19]MCO4696704.1 (2Fe-2S)-binding protein [Streptomyces sp. RO-S4]
MDLDPRLTALRGLGGFFVLRAAEEAGRRLPTLDQAYGPRRPDVQGAPLTDSLTDPLNDPLAVRVRRVGAALRAPEPRVAASVAHQGLAARLWSVALGCAALYGAVPDLDPEAMRWDPEGSAPDDLWLTEVRPLPGDAETLAEVVLHGHLEPLAAALRTRHRLAPGLLRGNAASALAASARELSRHARPDVASRAARLSRELLAHPLLTGSGTLTGTAFRRRSCCLYYRVPGGGVCGDCCFVRPPRSSPRAPSG